MVHSKSKSCISSSGLESVLQEQCRETILGLRENCSIYVSVGPEVAHKAMEFYDISSYQLFKG